MAADKDRNTVYLFKDKARRTVNLVTQEGKELDFNQTATDLVEYVLDQISTNDGNEIRDGYYLLNICFGTFAVDKLVSGLKTLTISDLDDLAAKLITVGMVLSKYIDQNKLKIEVADSPLTETEALAKERQLIASNVLSMGMSTYGLTRTQVAATMYELGLILDEDLEALNLSKEDVCKENVRKDLLKAFDLEPKKNENPFKKN